jgi:hypothetical protein
MKPSFKEVKENLAYLPIKGEFWWIKHRHGRIMDRPAGSVSGKNKTGYLQIYFNGKPYPATHLAWLLKTGSWPPHQIDHKNLVRSDNRWGNLRLATRSQNFGNQRAYKNNKVGLKGVSLFKPSGRWQAQIQVEGKKISLGHFGTPEEAHTAYVEASKKYFGEFARAK